jgi:hypothetical protein
MCVRIYVIGSFDKHLKERTPLRNLLLSYVTANTGLLELDSNNKALSENRISRIICPSVWRD